MRYPAAFATALIAAATLTVAESLPAFVGYLAVVAVTAVAVVATVRAHGGELPVRASPGIIVLLAVLWAVFAVALVLNPTGAALTRAPAFVVSSAVFVLVVPAAVPRAAIERGAALVATIAVLLGLPGTITGGFWVGWIHFPIGRTLVELPGVSGLHAMSSAFSTPTAVAVLSLFGLFGGLHRTLAARREDARAWPWAICSLFAAAGLALAWSRVAFLALACCAVLAAVHRLADWRALAVGVAGLCAAAAAGVLAVLFAPDLWRAVGPSLTGRAPLWRGVAELIAARPLSGWGFASLRPILQEVLATDPTPGPGYPTSTHNSYLRLFLVGGIVGGVAYLALMAGAVRAALRRVRAGADVWVLLWVVAVVVIQVFEGATVFGLSLSSVLFALAIGYAQPESATRTVTLPLAGYWRRASPVTDGGD